MWALRRKTSRRSQLGLRRWWDAVGGVQALGWRVKVGVDGPHSRKAKTRFIVNNREKSMRQNKGQSIF
jgi:peptidyl-tRNA hydrolase